MSKLLVGVSFSLSFSLFFSLCLLAGRLWILNAWLLVAIKNANTAVIRRIIIYSFIWFCSAVVSFCCVINRSLIRLLQCWFFSFWKRCTSSIQHTQIHSRLILNVCLQYKCNETIIINHSSVYKQLDLLSLSLASPCWSNVRLRPSTEKWEIRTATTTTSRLRSKLFAWITSTLWLRINRRTMVTNMMN